MCAGQRVLLVAGCPLFLHGSDLKLVLNSLECGVQLCFWELKEYAGRRRQWMQFLRCTDLMCQVLLLGHHAN